MGHEALGRATVDLRSSGLGDPSPEEALVAAGEDDARVWLVSEHQAQR